MKVKELDVTANLAWSPAQNSTVFLATGTAAQQLDASFSTNSALEIHALNLAEAGHQMPKLASFPVDHRYHKLIWGECGMNEGARPNGIIVGGLDQGVMTLYDAHKLLKGEHQGSVIESKKSHSGAVQALDFNPFQSNLLASGGSESEIFIWDVNKLTSPMNPGAKSQPLDDVRCVAWNKQVQHILGTTFASRCVVWDLRKNEPIIKVSDSTSRMRTKMVSWHPEVATQLCLASEDDHTPVIQIWDLRLASSPIRTLEGHQRGILSMAWCAQDSDLLLSCGKDNRILCWNPNTGEILCELASSNQWSFDVEWCPRNPAVIASASFDGHVSVYSLMGGQQQIEPSTSIADSFPGMEKMQPMVQAPTVTMQLKTPPKWLKRPCGASFGFGGKLVTFDTVKPPANQQQPGAKPQSSVHIGRVITEPELVERSQKLETSIQTQNLPEFCDLKIATASKAEDRDIWKFIKANFGENPRLEFLELLEFSAEKNARQVEALSGIKVPDLAASAGDQLSQSLAGLNTTDDKENAFETIAAKASSKEDEEVEMRRQKTFRIVTDESPVGLLSKTLLTGNLELAVEICLQQNRMSDAIILASQGSPDLLERTRKRYFAKCTSDDSYLIEAVVTGDWKTYVQQCSDANWKEALVAAITYASNEEFSAICSSIGDRLQGRQEGQLGAMLCYICAGDLEKLVECLMRTRFTSSEPLELQDLVEIVMSLKLAIEQAFGQIDIPTGALSAKLAQYAGLLAAQGALGPALVYLGNSTEDTISDLRDRLNGALGRSRQQVQAAPAGGRLSALRKSNRTVSQSSEDFGDSTQAARRRSSGHQQYPQQYQQQQQHVPPPQPQMFQPSTPYQPSGYAMPNLYDPTRRSSLTPEVNPAPPVSMAPPPAGSYVPDQGGPGHAPPVSNGPGWNDPPTLTQSKPRPAPTKTVPSSQSVAEPITQPLFGMPSQMEPPQPPMGSYAPPPGPSQMSPPPVSQYGAPVQPPSANFSGYGDYNISTPTSYGGYQPQAPAPAPGPVMSMAPPANIMTPSAPVMSQPMPAANLAAQQRQAEPPVQKGPIPSEHQVLQDVFDKLRDKCVAAANHPQVKRKLDDVARKLEILYDKLRAHELNEATVHGLHNIAHYIKAYDYVTALGTVNSLVNSGSFATLSEFLPGVKVLLQVAKQLEVYLETSQY